MNDPNAQATLLLSFLRERQQKAMTSSRATTPAGRPPRFSQRVLAACGSALISLGNHMIQRGYDGPQRLPTATIVRDGGYTK